MWRFWGILCCLFSLVHIVVADESILLDRATIVNYSPRIGLALGGGSARGLTHVGVLSVFEEEGIPIAAVSGTSMGAIVGSFYALGFSAAEIEQEFKKLDMQQVFTLTQFPRRTYIGKTPLHTFFEEEPVGIFHSYPVEEFLRQRFLLRDYQYQFDFDRYPTKLRIVATDFLSGDKVVFSQGPVYQAVCASMSLPFIFKPYEWQGKYFVDGALAENVPVSPLLGVSLDYRIAVDVSQPETGDERIYRLDSYTWQLSAIMIENISRHTVDQADQLVQIPPTIGLTKDSYDKLPEFINIGQRTMQASFAPIRSLVAKYDAQAEQLIVRRFRNETSRQIDLPVGVLIAKTALLRKIYKQVRPFSVEVSFTDNPDGTKDLSIAPADYQTTLAKPRINEIRIAGNKYIATEVIREMIKINTPTLYDQPRLDQMIRYLYSTGCFSSVHTTLEHDPAGGVILVVTVKEIRKGLLYLDGAYYSAEGLPELELGFYDSYRLGRNRLQFSLRTGPYAGGMGTFEVYDVLGSNLGFGLAYDHTNRDIRLYTEFEPEERVRWQQTATDIYLNYTSYDYFYATLGLRDYSFLLQTEAAQKKYYVPRLHVEYDALDQIYIPQKGFRFDGDWEAGLERQNVKSWVALALPQQYSLWLRYTKFHVPRTEYYLQSSPERSLLPFGFMPSQGLAATYAYTRLSLVHPLIAGFSVETALDEYSGDVRSNGAGVFVHYPLDVGCISTGYGVCFDKRVGGVLSFNFTKSF